MILYNGQEAGAIYTHHQKTVILDADAGQHKRKLIAFIGGLDLCKGRYDTPEHSLFRTLQTVHKDDYHNPNFVVCNRSIQESSLMVYKQALILFVIGFFAIILVYF